MSFYRIALGCVLLLLSFASRADEIRVACVGNSITFGARVANREKNSYPKQLQYHLGDKYEVRNFGVSGRTLLSEGDRPYINTKQYQNALDFTPDILIVMLGTNDSKLRNRVKLHNFKKDYKSLVQSFRERNKKLRVVAMLPPPSFYPDSTKIWNPVIKNKIIPLTQELAYENDWEVVDLYHLFIDKKYLMPDKIHPSSLGATVIARRLYEAIQLDSESETEETVADTNFNIFEKLDNNNGTEFNFYGFKGKEIEKDGLQLKIVQPKQALKDKPWVWRARFWGHEPQTDVAMLERGFHIVYCEVGTYFGAPEAVERWNKCYALTQKIGLNSKACLEGMSRGGLIIYNWAVRNPKKVAAIYADAPVLDARSWPGGFGTGKGSPSGWVLAKKHYNITNDKDSETFTGWPIHFAKEMANSNIPMLHICGDADKVVPHKENTEVFAEEVKKYGGNITTLYKKEGGHHPHSLQDPTTIVNFFLRATGHKINFATMVTPASEYRSAAGWQKGKDWWAQAHQIDSLCQATKDVDLLLIGNSITQGWGGPRDWVTYKPGQESADKHFEGLTWIGAGISGDRTQHVAWRIGKGNYEKCNPKFVVLAIGVNNFPDDSADEIADGIVNDLRLIEERMPKAKVILTGPLPTGHDPLSERRTKHDAIHKLLASNSFGKNVRYHTLAPIFVKEDNTLNKEYIGADGIHLKPNGYDAWAKEIRSILNNW